MDRSEPSLVQEWLRSNGSGGTCHQFATSQADGHVLALPRRTRSSKNISNSDSLHSPLLDHSSSTNSRRSSNSNGFHKHDKKSYTRPYSSYSRSHRDRDRERSVITDSVSIGNSLPVGGEAWTSALVEVPYAHGNNNSNGSAQLPNLLLQLLFLVLVPCRIRQTLHLVLVRQTYWCRQLLKGLLIKYRTTSLTINNRCPPPLPLS